MKIATSLIALGITAALSGVSSSSYAAQEKEIDSAFQWGRWAVLSPAAGNPEYQAVSLAGAGNSDRDDILPNAGGTDGGQPPVDPPVTGNGFCNAGSSCGYATYSSQTGEEEGTGNGPLLAKFSLETSTASSTGEGAQIAAISGDRASFSVTEAGDVNFPDIQSVDLNEDNEGFWSGTGTPVSSSADLNDAGTRIDTTTTHISGIEEVEANNFDGVDTGHWTDTVETSDQFVPSDEDLVGVDIPSQTISFSHSSGFFVHGNTATIEQMQAFTAGSANAVYQGKMLGFGSPVTLQFNFSGGDFNGIFGDGNGFIGFEIGGVIQGVNFVADDGQNVVDGSFFNDGLTAAGAAKNQTQQGIFVTDKTIP